MQPTESISALAASSLDSHLIDDPRLLDDEQLMEIVKAFHVRTTSVGVVGAVATAAVAVALTPFVWFAGFAVIPAMIAGLATSNQVVSRTTANRFGVTLRCLRQVEVTFDAVARGRDLRTLKAKDWVRTDWRSLVGLLRAELARAP